MPFISEIYTEDAQGISLRMQAWCKHHQRPRPQNFHVLGTGGGMPCAVELMDTPQIDDLISTLLAHQIKLVVIDTLSQCSGGAEENGSDMTRLAAACNRIAHTTGAAVIVIHHTTKDGKHYRGHSSLKDNTYGFFDVSKEDDVINLSKVRIKNTGGIADRHFRLITMDLGTVDTYGEPITSAVALPAHKVRVTGDDLTPSRRDVLSQIALMQDADEAPKAAQLKQSLRDMHERTFYRVLKWLREHGFVKQGLLGNRYYITDAGRDKLEQAGEVPNSNTDLLLDEDYFLVNASLPEPEPDPPPFGGASYSPPVPPTSLDGSDTGGASSSMASAAHVHHPVCDATDEHQEGGTHAPTSNAMSARTPAMAGRTEGAPEGASAGPADATPDTTARPAIGYPNAENEPLTPDQNPDTPPAMSGMSVPAWEDTNAGGGLCDTSLDTTDISSSRTTIPNTGDTDTHCHATDSAPVPPADPALTDLPPASERQWQSVPGQPAAETSEESSLIRQARDRLEQAATLLKAGEPDSTVRTLLHGLSGWLKRIVRSGIDRMIQARHSGQMSVDEALRLSLNKLQAGGAP